MFLHLQIIIRQFNFASNGIDILGIFIVFLAGDKMFYFTEEFVIKGIRVPSLFHLQFSWDWDTGSTEAMVFFFFLEYITSGSDLVNRARERVPSSREKSCVYQNL